MISIQQLMKLVSANLPPITAGIAMAGVGITAIESGRASIKAGKKLEEMHYTMDHEPTNTEKVVAVAPYYFKTIVIGSLTILCIFVCLVDGQKKLIAMGTAYSLSEKGRKELEEKTEELFGENKFQKIKEEISKDHIAQNPPDEKDIYQVPGAGNSLFYDAMAEEYFRSDVESLRTAEMVANQRCKSHGFVSVNTFRSLTNRAPMMIGDRIGWHCPDDEHFFPEDGDKIVDIAFIYSAGPNGEPCAELYYQVEPKEGFDMFG